MSIAMLDTDLREYASQIRAALEEDDTLDFPDAVIVFQAISECIAGLQQVKRELARHIADSTDDKKITVPGVGTVDISWSQSRKKWDWPRLISVVVARAVDDPETLFDPLSGEVLPPAVIGENVTKVLMRCVHTDYARKGALERLGLDIDTYSEKGEWMPQVKVTP